MVMNGIDEEDYEIINLVKNKKSIFLVNKIDIIDNQEMYNELVKYNKNVIKISAKNGEGIDELYNCISEMYNINEIEVNDEDILTNLRHKEDVDEAINHIDEIKNVINNKMPVDITEIYLKQVLTDLNKITGEDVTDDIINKIFSKFCLGK